MQEDVCRIFGFSLQPWEVAIIAVQVDRKSEASHSYFSLGGSDDCKAISRLSWEEGVCHMVITLKEAKDIDRKSRVLPIVYSDAK